MHEPSIEDVKKALTPFHARIRTVVERGFSEWLSVADCRIEKGYDPVLYPRTVSNYVFDAIARNARTEFGADIDVRVVDETQTVKFCFGSAVIARFKKGDEYNLGQNVPTQAVLKFLDPQETLPGLPPAAAKVDIIWAANDLGTEIESISVVARNGGNVMWTYEIEATVHTGAVIAFPAAEEADEKPIVTPRRKDADTSAGD